MNWITLCYTNCVIMGNSLHIYEGKMRHVFLRLDPNEGVSASCEWILNIQYIFVSNIILICLIYTILYFHYFEAFPSFPTILQNKDPQVFFLRRFAWCSEIITICPDSDCPPTLNHYPSESAVCCNWIPWSCDLWPSKSDHPVEEGSPWMPCVADGSEIL